MGGLIRATFPRNINLRISVPKGLLNVVADATQLHQVLMNLSVNARDAMPSGGSLRVSAENVLISDAEAQIQPEAQPGWQVVLSVSDTATASNLRSSIAFYFRSLLHNQGARQGHGVGSLLRAVARAVEVAQSGEPGRRCPARPSRGVRCSGAMRTVRIGSVELMWSSR